MAAKPGRSVIESAPPYCLVVVPRIAGNGARTIIVESPDRFARDLSVQLAGHDHLRKLGVTLVPATAPDFFIKDTPTAVLVRQVLGALPSSTRPPQSPSSRRLVIAKKPLGRSAAAVKATPSGTRRWSIWHGGSGTTPMDGHIRSGRLPPNWPNMASVTQVASHTPRPLLPRCWAPRRRPPVRVSFRRRPPESPKPCGRTSGLRKTDKGHRLTHVLILFTVP